MAKARMRRAIGKLLKELKIPSKLYRGHKFKGPYFKSGFENELQPRWLEALESGNHITDERGVLLPEFRHQL